MYYPILQKLTLMAAALVVTSLTLSAQADSPKLLSARQAYGPNTSVNPIHRLLFPASTYMIDDGTSEYTVGYNNGQQTFEALWFNQFEVIPDQETIASVSVVWGSPPFRPNDINDTPVTIAVWSDPNGDGNPSDAALLGSTNGFIINGATDRFVTYPFSPAITLPPGATSFFLGDMTPMNNEQAQFPQGIDQNSILHRQSWVAAMSDLSPVDINNLGNNDFIGIIDDFGIPGNWLIRADAGDGSQNITLTAKLSREQGKRVVVLDWTPAQGAGVTVTRNGNVIATKINDGHTQFRVEGRTEVQIYQLCATNGGCSNQVRVKINPRAD